MEFTRTICLPLHYGTDRLKLEKLDKLTARLSYCISIFLDLIKSTGIATKSGLAEFENDVQASTKLSAGFIQQCRDKAVWLWKSYNELHKNWERKVARCKDEKYLKKLMKREPSKPIIRNKIPARLDSRTVSFLTAKKLLPGKPAKLLKKSMALTSFWLNVSTLVKGSRMMLPLKIAKYHVKRLEGCSRIIDCEIVKKGKKYYANLSCEFIVPNTEVKYLRTVDLGILRSLSTVLFDCKGNLVKNSFKVFDDNLLQARLNGIDEKIKMQQYKQNWKFLKKLRANRKNLVEYCLRKSAGQFAVHCIGCKVVIGYPKLIKYRHFKGNGNKKHRKRLARWCYGRQIDYISQACEALGVETKAINEYNSSKRCCNCGTLNTVRPYANNYSLIHCNDCHYTYNADFNACVNFGVRTIVPQRSAMAGPGSK